MSIFSFLKANPILKHLVFSAMTLVILFYSWLQALRFYTLHDNHIEVPEYINFSVNQIDSISQANNLRHVIIDSIFDMQRRRGIVVNQDPDPLINVKAKRRIYLTINSLESRRVNFPDIYDLSLRQAISKLEKIGIEVGELEYRADIATNKVLDFKINGIKIKKGQELYVGTVVDLVIGRGLSKQSVIIPNLVGLTRLEANIVLKSASLNIGSEIFRSLVKDSLHAIIYKQYPIGNEADMLNIGSSIDLYFENPETQK